MMDVVSTVDELSFFLRRFAPRVTLRLSSGAVTAISPEAETHVRAAIAYETKNGRDVIVGIAEDAAGHPEATTVELFSPQGIASPQYRELLGKFFQSVLKRLPARASFIRAVVIVEGLGSVPALASDEGRMMIVRALEDSRAAAVVIAS